MKGFTRIVIPAMIVVALGAIVFVLTQAAGGPGASGGPEQFAAGGMAKLKVLPEPPAQPVDTFTGPDGTPVTLSDYRGKVVLVNIWATWCTPCVKEMPTLGQLQSEYAGKDFLVIPSSVDGVPDTDYARGELAKLSGGVLPFFHDPNYALAYGASAAGFPTSILYDRQGNEIARVEGEADWNSPEAHKLIDWALAR